MVEIKTGGDIWVDCENDKNCYTLYVPLMDLWEDLQTLIKQSSGVERKAYKVAFSLLKKKR